jgi:hypothetical protein
MIGIVRRSFVLAHWAECFVGEDLQIEFMEPVV